MSLIGSSETIPSVGKLSAVLSFLLLCSSNYRHTVMSRELLTLSLRRRGQNDKSLETMLLCDYLREKILDFYKSVRR
eukprot:UN12053